MVGELDMESCAEGRITPRKGKHVKKVKRREDSRYGVVPACCKEAWSGEKRARGFYRLCRDGRCMC